MNVVVIDGHPDHGRLVSHLLQRYVAALPAGTEVVELAVRDLTFDGNLQRGFAVAQPWEPDLVRVANAINDADHVVFGFPLWWGAEPAQLKGLLDRLLLPGVAFKYRRGSAFWDRLLTGRSADVVITMDSPPSYLRWVLGDPVGKRWKKQILDFVGFSPVRFHYLGMTRRGGAKKHVANWTASLQAAASSVGRLRRGAKQALALDEASVQAALVDRQS